MPGKAAQKVLESQVMPLKDENGTIMARHEQTVAKILASPKYKQLAKSLPRKIDMVVGKDKDHTGHKAVYHGPTARASVQNTGMHEVGCNMLWVKRAWVHKAFTAVPMSESGINMLVTEQYSEPTRFSQPLTIFVKDVKELVDDVPPDHFHAISPKEPIIAFFRVLIQANVANSILNLD